MHIFLNFVENISKIISQKWYELIALFLIAICPFVIVLSN